MCQLKTTPRNRGAIVDFSLWLTTLAVLATSCFPEFGYGVVRLDPLTLVENLHDNRYVYRSTRPVQSRTRGPAVAVVAVSPAGAREIGAIEVTVVSSGFGAAGMRTLESQFHPRLGEIAGEMGGTHFTVLRASRGGRDGVFITSLVVNVLDASPVP